MIKSIEFREGALHLAIACPRASASGKCKCRVQFDFGERSAVTECHRSEFMDLIKPVNSEGSHEISDMVLELFDTEPRIRWVDLHLSQQPPQRLGGQRSAECTGQAHERYSRARRQLETGLPSLRSKRL